MTLATVANASEVTFGKVRSLLNSFPYIDFALAGVFCYYV